MEEKPLSVGERRIGAVVMPALKRSSGAFRAANDLVDHLVAGEASGGLGGDGAREIVGAASFATGDISGRSADRASRSGNPGRETRTLISRMGQFHDSFDLSPSP